MVSECWIVPAFLTTKTQVPGVMLVGERPSAYSVSVTRTVFAAECASAAGAVATEIAVVPSTATVRPVIVLIPQWFMVSLPFGKRHPRAVFAIHGSLPTQGWFTFSDDGYEPRYVTGIEAAISRNV
jgi:hypothetical protein